MVQLNALSPIISFVEANHKITSPEECVVVLDATSKKAVAVVDLQGKMRLERRSVTGQFHKRKHVLVINSNHGRKTAEGKLAKPLYDVAAIPVFENLAAVVEMAAVHQSARMKFRG